MNATYPESSEPKKPSFHASLQEALLIFTMIGDGDSVDSKRLQEKLALFLPLVLKNARVSKKRRILYVLVTSIRDSIIT